MQKLSLSTKILIALILGIIAGLVFAQVKPFIDFVKPFGTLFLNLIKMIIVPLVLASLVTGAASVSDVKKLGRVGGKTLGYYLITTAAAVTLGLVLGNLIDPGLGMTLPAGAKYAGKEAVPISQVLLDMIPVNPIKSLGDANMLQIIIFAVFLGSGITLVGDRAKPVFYFFDGLAETTYKITGMVMEFAPYGVFALITPVVAANGPAVLIPLAKVIITVYAGCILHAAIVYSLAVKTLGNMSPITFFKGILPAMVVAFTTCSSSATLPISMKAARENLGVSKEVASFVQPLGATVNMDGTAIYQGVCALFVAQVFGLELTIGQQLTVILTATLASVGTAGVPSAGLIMLTMVLAAVKLPLEGMALIAGIDRILDMIRTAVNVTGDASAAVIIEYSEKKNLAQRGSLVS